MRIRYKRVCSLLLAVALSVSVTFCLTGQASAAKLETVVDSSSMHRTTAISTTTSVSVRSSVVVQTIVHKKGNQSFRSLDGTYYYTASASLDSPKYASTFASHASSLGLSYRRQMLATDLSVTIAPSEPSKTYSVCLIWSGMRWNQKVETTYSGGHSIDQDHTIAYVPCSTSEITGWYLK